jgi:hypothetical protein
MPTHDATVILKLNNLAQNNVALTTATKTAVAMKINMEKSIRR